jgi:hypothetical protein
MKRKGSGRNPEESDHGLLVVISWHLRGGTEDNHEKPHVRVACTPHPLQQEFRTFEGECQNLPGHWENVNKTQSQ